MKNSKRYVLEVTGCMIVVIICAIIVFTYQDFPARLMAAILGVVITATITVVLLDGQSKKEQMAKRNSKIFEEKLKIYQDFLTSLYETVKTRQLSEDEKLQLEFKTSLVAMHCKPQNLELLSEAVKKVIENACPSDNKRKQKSQDEIPLLRDLLGVVEAFRIDLYDVDRVKDGELEDDSVAKMLFSSTVKSRTINNFKEVYKEIENTESSEELLTECVDKKNIWNQAVEKWQSAGWIVKALEDEDCPLQITRNDGNPGMIDMGFFDNHYYIQARYEGDWNFSKCLKWDNGGRRQRELWWEYPSLSMDVPKGGFIDKFKSSPELQQQVIKRVEYLMGVIEKEHSTIQWMQAVGEQKDWKLFTWYWSTLACESQSEKEGKIYMDTMPSEEDKTKAVIQLGNRANNIEQLKNTLERIGCPEKIKDIDDEGCFVNLDIVDSVKPEDVSKRLKYWIGKLSGK